MNLPVPFQLRQFLLGFGSSQSQNPVTKTFSGHFIRPHQNNLIIRRQTLGQLLKNIQAFALSPVKGHAQDDLF